MLVTPPIKFRFPSDRETWLIDRQFLWGRALLITPILEKVGHTFCICILKIMPECKSRVIFPDFRLMYLGCNCDVSLFPKIKMVRLFQCKQFLIFSSFYFFLLFIFSSFYFFFFLFFSSFSFKKFGNAAAPTFLISNRFMTTSTGQLNYKQLSVLNFVSISNHLKIEKNNNNNKNESSNKSENRCFLSLLSPVLFTLFPYVIKFISSD